jgi:predicted Fe-Mo cluster-binding NifX family protein
MNKIFAFAVSRTGNFEAKHFGDADKYLLYEYDGHDFTVHKELLNSFKNYDEEQEHVSRKKGEAIIQLLQENSVQVLVSKQFGKNIKMVNRFFIPVIIGDETIPEAITKLRNNMKWIEEELSQNTQNFKLFTLKTGILKSVIKNDEPDR